uniref:HDC12634 n=1 Tax=Drosophila melanogaster TaxID=7227 RepID=Q6IKE7_DROME|nr:TPA_inf: HDC12634 [Drosophila melanogaster]
MGADDSPLIIEERLYVGGIIGGRKTRGRANEASCIKTKSPNGLKHLQKTPATMLVYISETSTRTYYANCWPRGLIASKSAQFTESISLALHATSSPDHRTVLLAFDLPRALCSVRRMKLWTRRPTNVGDGDDYGDAITALSPTTRCHHHHHHHDYHLQAATGHQRADDGVVDWIPNASSIKDGTKMRFNSP